MDAAKEGRTSPWLGVFHAPVMKPEILSTSKEPLKVANTPLSCERKTRWCMCVRERESVCEPQRRCEAWIDRFSHVWTTPRRAHLAERGDGGEAEGEAQGALRLRLRTALRPQHAAYYCVCVC